MQCLSGSLMGDSSCVGRLMEKRFDKMEVPSLRLFCDLFKGKNKKASLGNSEVCAQSEVWVPTFELNFEWGGMGDGSSQQPCCAHRALSTEMHCSTQHLFVLFIPSSFLLQYDPLGC